MITIIFGRAAQFLLALVMMRVATTLLSPEEMGRVSLVITTIAFFALFLVNPVGMFINRRLHAWQACGVAWHYLIRYVNYLIFVALIAGVVLLLLYMSGLVNFGLSIGWLIFLVCASLFFNTINQTAIPSLNLLGDSRRFVALTVATIAASFACATLFVQMVQPSAQYWLLGLLLGQTLLGVIGTRVLFVRLKKTKALHVPLTICGRNLHTLFSFAWPIAIAVGLGWVQSQSYRYLMEERLGLMELGLFVAGYGISAGLISAFESVFTTYLQPIFYKQVSNENVIEQSKAWADYAGAIFPSLMLVGLVIFAIAPELPRVMLGAEYWSSSQFIGWGVVAEMARVASGVYGMVTHARMKTRLLLIPSLLGASLSIALIWWLMPKYGSNGVGVALMLSSVAAFILTYASTRNEFTVNFPRRMLILSMCMGLGLILFAGIFRTTLGENGNLVASAIQILVVGVIFLSFQYILLRPLLHRNRTHG